MFHIEDHTEFGLFVFYGENHQDNYVTSLSCCALGIHAFDKQALIGFNVCDCCGQIEALFALCDSVREDGAGSIYLTVRIEDVREFAGSATVAECKQAATQVINCATQVADRRSNEAELF